MRGLIQCVDDPRDRGAVYAVITDDGRGVAGEAERAMHRALSDAFLDPLTETDAAALRRALARLT